MKKAALAGELTDQNRAMDAMLDILQHTGPEFSAAKKGFEALKESDSEIKAKLLWINENNELLWESFEEELKRTKDLLETKVNKDEL